MPPDAPTPAAEIRASSSPQVTPFVAVPKDPLKASSEMRSGSLLPTEADARKSRTIGRYQFRKEGAGWECREIVGKGVSRKRIYLAHLSRASYEEMQARATDGELESELIKWAESKLSSRPSRRNNQSIAQQQAPPENTGSQN